LTIFGLLHKLSELAQAVEKKWFSGAAFLFLLWDARQKSRRALEILGLAAEFTAFYVFLVILLWPYLWEDPIGRMSGVFYFITHVPWKGPQLYLGEYYACGETPWHYIPVWVGISTPLLYLGLFLIGSAALIGDLLAQETRSSAGASRFPKVWGPLVLLWFFAPVLGSIALGVCTFNEFRHLFFIYPALILMGLRGLVAIFKLTDRFNDKFASAVMKLILGAVIMAEMGRVAFFMVKYHPHENVYFNRLAGRDMASIARKFEMDYWGLSYKQGLEYILRLDASEVIPVSVDFRPGQFNVRILPAKERHRLTPFLPIWVYLNLNRKLIRFAEANPSKYFINRRFKYLVIRSRMTAEEKEELRRICRSPQEREAIERAYRDSQRLAPAKYFLTNYSLYPGEFPLEKIDAIKVGNASILGIYRLHLDEVP